VIDPWGHPVLRPVTGNDFIGDAQQRIGEGDHQQNAQRAGYKTHVVSTLLYDPLKERLGICRVESLRDPRIGAAKQRLQPMNDFTNNVAWWLSMDALTIAMMLTITFTVIWLAR
jgi:hypothetical protein